MSNDTLVRHEPFQIDRDALDALMPMHLRLDRDGRILHAGPTILKMMATEDVIGRHVFDLFRVHAASEIATLADLFAASMSRLKLSLTRTPDIVLRGNLVRAGAGEEAILDISLGLAFVRAVAEFGLTIGDFAATDQTVNLLYLHEANTNTSRLSRHLTERLKAAHASAEHQARTDVLTGLANRRSIDDDLERLLANSDEQFSVLQIDLDLFKQVNDTYGHPAGDAVLQAVGRIFNDELRRNDLPSRVGGDEFLVVLRDVVEPAVAGRIAGRLIQRIEEPVPFEGITCKISASIGIATLAQYAERPNLAQIIADVDAALYKAKNSGRGRYAFHSNLTLHDSVMRPVDRRRPMSDFGRK